MKWTDENIDKLFRENSEKMSFGYKSEYWDEFSASLSEGGEGTNWSDDKIDALFREHAPNFTIPYSVEYWNAFNASVSGAQTVEHEWSDNYIDNLFRESAQRLTIPYKNEYWVAFNAALPVYVPSNGGADSEAEIDEMFREGAEDISFQYDPAYWKEMEAMLPEKRRQPDFLWFGAAAICIGLLTAVMIRTVTSENEVVFSSGEMIADETGSANTNSNVTPERNVISNQGAVNETVSSQVGQNPESATNTVENENAQHLVLVDNTQDPIRDAGSSNPVETNETIDVVANDQHSVSGNDNDVQEVRDITENPSDRENEIADALNNEGSVEAQGEAGDLAEADLLEWSKLEPGEMTFPELNPTLVLVNPYERRRAFTELYVQGIGGMSQSYITPSEHNAYSYGLGLGLEVRGQRWAFTAGANGIVENHNDLQLTRIAKVYGFGSDVYKYNMDYQQLYKLEGWLGLGYNLGRHRFDVGVRPSFLLSTKVRIQEMEELTSTTPDGSNTLVEGDNTARQVYGYMEGLNRFGIKPTVGYAFSPYPGMSIGINVGVQMLPSINEEYISGFNNNLPVDGQIYFRKSFRLK